jgi:alpha-beta hydrolase superfamily lysophospholipase
MDLVLGRLRAQLERPQTRKFAWPMVVIPELFSSCRHLSLIAGHLVSLGWEVYLLDTQALIGAKRDRAAEAEATQKAFSALVADTRAAVAAIGSDVIAAGHGLGGLIALKIAEAPSVRAAVALAPLLPGYRSPLFVHGRRWAFWRSKSSGLPTGRSLLELVAEAEPFQRGPLIKTLVPADSSAAFEIANGAVEFTAVQTPTLIVAGEADAFAPWQRAEHFAQRIGAQFISLPGRGHWMIAGRKLGQTISLVQRFLVRELGEDLLLLYAEGSGDDGEDQQAP